MAGLPGLEPRLTESESAVLPLDDSPTGMALFYVKIRKIASFFSSNKKGGNCRPV